MLVESRMLMLSTEFRQQLRLSNAPVEVALKAPLEQ
jgi:hypothetical protein